MAANPTAKRKGRFADDVHKLMELALSLPEPHSAIVEAVKLVADAQRKRIDLTIEAATTGNRERREIIRATLETSNRILGQAAQLLARRIIAAYDDENITEPARVIFFRLVGARTKWDRGPRLGEPEVK